MVMVPPSDQLWHEVNLVIEGENAAEVIASIVGGLAWLIRRAMPGLTKDRARAHLAAIVLSPSGHEVGALLPRTEVELAAMVEETARSNERIWRKVKRVIVHANLGETLASCLGGLTSVLRLGQPNATELEARAFLAAIVLSPAGRRPGSLLPLVEPELAKMRAESPGPN